MIEVIYNNKVQQLIFLSSLALRYAAEVSQSKRSVNIITVASYYPLT